MRRKDFTETEKNHVLQFLLEGNKNGRISRGRREAAVIFFNSSERTISRVWAEAMQQKEQGQVITFHNGKKDPRAKRVHIDMELIQSLELHRRTSIRSLACGIQRSPTTVRRWIDVGLIRAHTSPLRPELTAPNKLQRVQFSLQAIELDRAMNALRFKGMHNTIHIDEKWFYMTKGVQRYYLTTDELDPHRTCKSKKFITKVMFMCAVTRPIFGIDGSVLFDGKIGMFPFTYQEPAKRSSKNRPAGTMETKAVNSITKEVIRDCIIKQIIPAIRAKWPSSSSRHVYIQQDNARPHIKDNDPLFREASIGGDLTFTLVQQPPNSPDCNVNDLGWFQAIQVLQYTNVCHTVDELVKAVEKSYEELTTTKLNNVFLTLQGCLIEIMKVRGQNRYKVPHLGKEALIRAGTLPLNLEVDEQLVRESLLHLLEAGLKEEVEVLSNALGIRLTELEGE